MKTEVGIMVLNACCLLNSRVEFPIEKPEGCCIYRHAGIDYIALWDSLLPVREVFAPYVGTYV